MNETLDAPSRDALVQYRLERTAETLKEVEILMFNWPLDP